MLFVFDWDGTLSDSTGKIVGCLQEAARVVGLPELSEEKIKNIIGLGLREAIEVLYPGISELKLNALRSAYSDVYKREDQVPSPFFPGVEETLNILRDRGYSMAVATGKSRRGLNRVLHRLNMDGFFHATRCADETLSKPNPLMLEELLVELNYAPHTAVMVGDTEYDMEMALRAGVSRVAVTYGAHASERLEKYTPVLMTSQFAEVLSLIDDA